MKDKLNNLTEESKKLLLDIKEEITQKDPKAEISVFGDYAKNDINSKSILELLILTPTVFDTHWEEADYKYDLEEILEDKFGFDPEIRLVILNKECFNSKKENGEILERIVKYMIEVK